MPPRGLQLYKAQDGTATDNRSRGIYPDPVYQQRGEASRGKRTTTYSPPATADPLGAFGDVLQQYILGKLTGSGPTALGGSSQSTGSTLVMPPVLELLGEMRARRESAVAQAETLASIMSNNLPQGLTYYPGFEQGGLADVLLGIITGKGPAAAQQVLPQQQRLVQRTDLNVPAEQPTVGQEFGQGMSFADAIMAAIRNIQTSQSSSSSGGG